MRVFTKKVSDRGRRISSEIFGSDDENETRLSSTIHPTTTLVEEFSLSEDDKQESTSTATTIRNQPRVVRKRKSIEPTSKKTSSFDTSDSEQSEDSDYSSKKKKKKKQKQTKKKRNSKTSQDEEVDENFDKSLQDYIKKANQFFNEVDATKLQKANLKEEEELLSKQAEKEIQENAKKEQESIKDAQIILKSQKSTELQREILEGTYTSKPLSPEALQKKEEERKQQEKRQEYERYCRSVEGIVPPLSYEEFVINGDQLIPSGGVAELDDLDLV